ncbi:RNA-binding protein 25-like [Physella acuta]|uniref:RNA-binding protein 25-like n=1 Tax=Physella acuta TaxID=109671 RepID=UPI0027DB8F24|nr:RNA-binding protein 25-like [Physella acuta]
MEFSPLYTRRLSGSYSSRNSFVDDALEQLEFNINDISRASSPASVISVSARSEGFRERRHRSTGRADDEYRRKYSRIKSELELEKNKIRHLQEERVEEIRKLREAFENDRKLEMVSLQNRWEEDRKKELARFKEELIKQKDFELQQVLMYKESEKRQQVKAEEKKEKGKQKVDEEKLEVEDEDESIAGRDGDNDVATVSGKGQGREGGKEERRRQRMDKKHADDDLKHLDLVSKDGGSSQDHKRSRSHRTVSGSEGDRDTVHRRRHRAHEKSEKHISDTPEPVILKSSEHEQVRNRKNDKHISDALEPVILESSEHEQVKNRKNDKHISDALEPVILESSEHEQVKNRKNDKHISDALEPVILESSEHEQVKNRKNDKHISDALEPVILESSEHEQVKNRKNDKHISDVVVSGVLENPESERVKNKTVKDTTSTQDAVASASKLLSEKVISKVSVDVQTDLLGTDIAGNDESKVDKENEKTSELEKRIKDLEVERI